MLLMIAVVLPLYVPTSICLSSVYLGMLYPTLGNGLLSNFGISEFQSPARFAGSSASVPQFCITGAVYCQQLNNVTNYVRDYT
jgi:hypothetical protein